MAPLVLVLELATRWRHLHELQIWPQDGTTCISCNIDHQMAPLALVANLPTRWRYLHCFQSWPPDCISCTATFLHWHYQLVLSLYLHQLESHQLSLHKWLSLLLRDKRTHRSDQGHLGPIKNRWNKKTDLLRDGRFYRALLCAHWGLKEGENLNDFHCVDTIYVWRYFSV